MEINDLKNKLVAVLGFCVEGKAITAYLIKHGIKPVLFDQKPWEKWEETEKLEIEKLGLNFIFGPDCFKELAGFDLIFRSPGISIKKLLSYKVKSYQVTSQTKWFFEHCPARIIGVTGTKGKGTTASLIYEILENNFNVIPKTTSASESLSGIQNFTQTGSRTFFSQSPEKFRDDNPNIFLTGNIGKVQPLSILDDLKKVDWVVFELSSFQLEDLTQSPHIGVVLMVTEEHLDYHQSRKEYIEAKTAITKFQTQKDIAVINADFASSLEIGRLGKGQKLYFSRKQEVGCNCFIKNGWVVGNGFKPLPTLRGEVKDLPAQNSFPIIKISDLQLRGAHNLENVCAATMAAICAGVGLKIIIETLKEFKGLEHRLEFVCENRGIKFYNDSFSTTPESSIAAIKAFTEPLIVILGGSSKGSDFSLLADTIIKSPNIKKIFLIGEEAKKIKLAILNIDQSFSRFEENFENLNKVFKNIKQSAENGDVVLLSPACASFGWFKNYKERGEIFKNLSHQF